VEAVRRGLAARSDTQGAAAPDWGAVKSPSVAQK
jgi:hypothetical protein